MSLENNGQKILNELKEALSERIGCHFHSRCVPSMQIWSSFFVLNMKYVVDKFIIHWHSIGIDPLLNGGFEINESDLKEHPIWKFEIPLEIKRLYFEAIPKQLFESLKNKTHQNPKGENANCADCADCGNPVMSDQFTGNPAGSFEPDPFIAMANNVLLLLRNMFPRCTTFIQNENVITTGAFEFVCSSYRLDDYMLRAKKTGSNSTITRYLSDNDSLRELVEEVVGWVTLAWREDVESNLVNPVNAAVARPDGRDHLGDEAMMLCARLDAIAP